MSNPDTGTQELREAVADKELELFIHRYDLTERQEKELKDVVRLVLEARIAAELNRIWKTAVDNNVAGPVKWEIEDRLQALRKEVSE